jgi:phosphatidylglycerol:prolipoprotein diacylglycerol transferase
MVRFPPRFAAMIPYLPPPTLQVGPYTLHAFGVLVGLGVLLGLLFSYRRAAQMGVPRREIRGAALWAVIPGFLGAAVFNVVFYQPEKLSERGLVALVDFSRGMSSYGGFAFAAAGVAAYAWARRRSWLRTADVLVQGLTLGWIFGRLGCTLVHDHPGKLTTFFLGFQYPEGTRHNLGFYEFLYTLLVIWPVILLLHRRATYRPGIYVATVALLYAPVRFLLDFWRLPELNPRAGGLVFSQYASLVLLAAGVWLVWRMRAKVPARAP